MPGSKPSSEKRQDSKTGTQPSHPATGGGPPPESKQSHPRDTDTPGQSQPKNWYNFKDPNWWLVILTPLGLVFAALQWYTADQSLRSVEKAYRSSSRAYVGLEFLRLWKTRMVGPGTFETVDEPGLQLTVNPIVDLRFTNKGETPANRVTGEAHMVIVSNTQITETTVLPRSFKATDRRSLSVIPKDGQHNLRAVMPSPMSIEDFAAVRSGRKFLIVHGAVEYSDTFGELHTTSFCRIYAPTVDNMVACSAYNWIK